MNGELTFVWSPATTVFSVVIILATAALCIWAWKRSRYSRGIGVLEALRLLLVVCIMLTLSQPEWREEYLPEQRPTVAVLWDQSRSMETQDQITGDDTTMLTRAEVVKPLLDASKWEGLKEMAEVVFEPFSSSSSNPRDATDLNSALKATQERHANLRGVVLISDGDWNMGSPPIRAASRLRSQGVPAFTIAVGSESQLPDIEVVSLDAPTFGVEGKPVRVPFTIDSALPRDYETTVSLRTESGEEILYNVKVPAMGRLQDTITWRPKSTGDITLTLSIPPERNEIDKKNNEQSARISIRSEELKVLVIESFPRWEYRYLRNALERDPGVNVNCLLFHPQLKKTGGGRPGYIEDFPSDAELAAYDVVFVGDVGLAPGQLTDKECDKLQRLVRDQASGLVFLPGFRGNHYSLLGTSLAGMYPVALDPLKRRGVGSQLPGRIELTEAGRKSLLTKLEDDDDSNSRVWEALPGFQWHAAAMRAKAGTETLATHRSSIGPFGRTPLLVTKTYGTGKVLFMGTDSAWRWRQGVEDKYHYRFWGQVARWMAYQRNMSEGQSMRLFHTPDRPKSGDVVSLNANVSSAFGEPLRDGTVVVQVAAPSGMTESIRMLPGEEESWGLFSNSFTPRESGEYILVMSSSETSSTLTTTLPVRGMDLEKPGQPARFDVLQEISTITRGKMLLPTQLDTIIKKIGALPEPEPLERRLRIWCHPLWGGWILLLFGIFWTGRKIAGTI
jgi:hypothetical protein